MGRFVSDFARGGAWPPATGSRDGAGGSVPIYGRLAPKTLADTEATDRAAARCRAAGRDPRLRRLRWQDLRPLTRREIVGELAVWTPWFAASLACAAVGLWIPALACSFLFFLTALRLIHDAQHSNLGIGAWGHHLVLFGMSVLMLGSNHAVRFIHLRHHQDTLGPSDVEGIQARLPAWKTVAFGPLYPAMIVWVAWANGGPAVRRWVAAELAANVAWIAAVLWLFEVPALAYHVAVMGVAQCLTAFFCVWSIHHHDADGPYPARTLHGTVGNRLTYNMFLHVEHHLFPAVPTAHLRTLARRLDAAAPDYRRLTVLPVRGAGAGSPR